MSEAKSCTFKDNERMSVRKDVKINIRTGGLRGSNLFCISFIFIAPFHHSSAQKRTSQQPADNGFLSFFLSFSWFFIMR